MASWTLFCRASRVRWSTGSTDWMSTLLITSPFWLKRRLDRTASFSSKPNTAEQMILIEFYRQKKPPKTKHQSSIRNKTNDWASSIEHPYAHYFITMLTRNRWENRCWKICLDITNAEILHVSDKSSLISRSLTHLVEVIKLHGSHSSSDPRGDGFTGVAHKIRHWEESCRLCGVWMVLYLKVPDHEEGQSMT